ncbi:MAG: hypothetical protein ACYS8Y_12185 [Planctomycetota bacterium]|jgi:hypothetical protein
MYYLLVQIILTASNSDGEETIWIQMLVLAILASLLGVGSIIKTRAKQFSGQGRDYGGAAGGGHVRGGWQNKTLKELKDKGLSIFSKTAKATVAEPAFDFAAGAIGREVKVRNKPVKKKDLAGGMEMLELDFLVKVVEETKDKGKNDVMMQKLSFNELLRRGELKEADSKALKIYAKNEDNLYGKVIQCEAMKELAKRTVTRPG